METIDFTKFFDTFAVRLMDRKTDSYPVRFVIFTPIYHPACSIREGIVYGSSLEDCIKQFTNLKYALKVPANIDATIDFRRDHDSFVTKNMKYLKGRYECCKDCPICEVEYPEPLETFIQ